MIKLFACVNFYNVGKAIPSYKDEDKVIELESRKKANGNPTKHNAKVYRSNTLNLKSAF